MRNAAIIITSALLVAGCGDPLRDVPRLQDVPVEVEAGQVDALPDATETALPDVATTGEAPKRGLLGFLRRKADAAQIVEAAEIDPSEGEASEIEAGAVEAGEVIVAADAVADVAESEVASSDVASEALAEPEAPARRGLFGFGKRRTASPASDTADEAEIELAALAPESRPQTDTATPDRTTDAPVRRGLFGGRKSASSSSTSSSRKAAGPKPGAPDYREVAFGTALPYGEIARVCGVPENKLGVKSQTWPERGRGYTLRDSAPGSTGARTFYMTGFKDGCARQFTAALVIFGSPETWEQIHYGPAGKSLPVSTTDRAYETVKRKACGVGKGKPCGAKMSKMAKSTVFVSVYQRFEDNTRWKNILLHDGEVVAIDLKG